LGPGGTQQRQAAAGGKHAQIIIMASSQYHEGCAEHMLDAGPWVTCVQTGSGSPIHQHGKHTVKPANKVHCPQKTTPLAHVAPHSPTTPPPAPRRPPAHMSSQLLHESWVVVAHCGIGPGSVAEALGSEALQLACSCLGKCLKQDGAAEAKLGKRPRRVGQALGGEQQWWTAVF
jgi:hypothetical protein